jgi:hypothetical protein
MLALPIPAACMSRRRYPMSRALNLDATLAEVTARCAKLATSITAIETLRSGGTRVVLKSADDAAVVSKAYGNKVMAGVVSRQPTRLMHHSAPEPIGAAPRSRWAHD